MFPCLNFRSDVLGCAEGNCIQIHSFYKDYDAKLISDLYIWSLSILLLDVDFESCPPVVKQFSVP